jgi:hypothetical protein
MLTINRCSYIPRTIIPPGRDHVFPNIVRAKTFEGNPALRLLEHAVLSIRGGLRQVRLQYTTRGEYRGLRPPECSTHPHPVPHPRGPQRVQSANHESVTRELKFRPTFPTSNCCLLVNGEERSDSLHGTRPLVLVAVQRRRRPAGGHVRGRRRRRHDPQLPQRVQRQRRVPHGALPVQSWIRRRRLQRE